MGSERKRSKTPFSMSVLTETPVYIVIITTDITRMPGSRNWMYSFGDPARAPPNRYVYISTIMIGNAVTSKSCSGTCLILRMARQPKVSEADSALGRRGRSPVTSSAASDSALTGARSWAALDGGWVTVLMRPSPRCRGWGVR